MAPDFEYSTAELERRINAYISRCNEEGRLPTEAGLSIALELPVSRLEVLAGYAYEYTKSNKSRRAVRETFEEERLQVKHLITLQRGLAAIRDELQQRSDTMAKFRLKQPVYGGFCEKPEEGGEVNDNKITVNIILKNSGDEAQPFK